MVKWKVPGWAGAAGAALSLAAGLAGGNPFGVVLLRALVSALLAGALGLGVQLLLRRFLPELGAAAPPPPPPGVDILVDEELPLAPQGGELRRGAEAEPAGGPALPPGPQAQPGLAEELLPGLPEEPEGLEEAGDFAGLTAAGGFLAEPEEPAELPEAGLDETGFSGEEDLPAAEEAPEGQGLETLPSGELPQFGEAVEGLPSRRRMKAGELESQLDDVTQGQDPASLAKAVRTFLRKDQEDSR